MNLDDPIVDGKRDVHFWVHRLAPAIRRLCNKLGWEHSIDNGRGVITIRPAACFIGDYINKRAVLDDSTTYQIAIKHVVEYLVQHPLDINDSYAFKRWVEQLVVERRIREQCELLDNQRTWVAAFSGYETNIDMNWDNFKSSWAEDV